MQLVFLYGPAAAGKLTIARELVRLTGLRLFHNHLVVDALLAAFEFGSESFVKLREPMWLDVFGEAARIDRSLIFTFAPEGTVSPGFVPRVVEVVQDGGGRVRFVRLLISPAEQERRIDAPSRRAFGKLTSLEILRRLRATGASAYPDLPAELTIDTEQMTPLQAARQIAEQFAIPLIG